ncbi:DUF1566 domain-containing protein [Ralstonia insidiosa]|uniref:DUF1566 domain-containing protein n=1 Tax=Ralstonia insidiosa TaxID=190721 RepID=UPI000CEE4684|nr:DUF1566 domain-containing protein [Ralstonia insidiosa]
MTITLEAIKAEHTKISEMIATFEKQAAAEYCIEAVTIPLAPGERVAGPVLNDDGTLSHYLIKLPGEADDIDWKDAGAWAQKRGGSLPTRQEQALLYANLKAEFQPAAYWSDQAHEKDSACAWFQDFTLGQGYGPKSAALRAVAVRRFIPSVI